MKYKIVATIVILFIIIVALCLRGCSTPQAAVDENGNPIPTAAEQY